MLAALRFRRLLRGAARHADNGRWRIAPTTEKFRTSRKYRADTLILETRFETDEGVATLIDFMPLRDDTSDIVRLVVGESGRVTMCMELVLRFGYGCIVPWVTRLPDRTLRAIAGPDMVLLHTPVEIRGENFKTVGEFTVAGRRDGAVHADLCAVAPAAAEADPIRARRWR